jgi:hypothetical protein
MDELHSDFRDTQRCAAHGWSPVLLECVSPTTPCLETFILLACGALDAPYNKQVQLE